MSCDCNKVDTEGCAPLPVVDRATRAIARAANGCPAELSGVGLVYQNESGAYIADGSAEKPLCLPNLISSASPNGLLGLTSSLGSMCYRSFLGNGMTDAGKVVKWDGTAFVLKSLLESLCYPSSVVQTTCCPSEGIAVWARTGDSMCLQQWNPCTDSTVKAVSNPKFVACEGGQMVQFSMCDLPELTAGTEYRTFVCTDDGPRVLGASGNVPTRQYVPFDLIGSGNPMLVKQAAYDQTNGAAVIVTSDLAVDSGAPIPAGATHVQLLVNFQMDNDDVSDVLSITLYSPAAVSDNNRRGYISNGNGFDDFMYITPSFTVPIASGGITILLSKSGPSSAWQSAIDVRLEGYWVG